MSEVVNFEEKAKELHADELILACGCGGTSFFIYDSFKVECTVCGELLDSDEVHRTLRRWTTKKEEKNET